MRNRGAVTNYEKLLRSEGKLRKIFLSKTRAVLEGRAAQVSQIHIHTKKIR